ncbi:hypothetical protein K438DRAFT_1975075 [Mycena galopus ATCC 62051]|nr:hypothetical protein K438DRAFT_1975926 [Mycena galopus ATCC 62051]KAF8183606.1 hypothetical protein K438DRAFT_1975075 [Mycena galopus ATCC 62051]
MAPLKSHLKAHASSAPPDYGRRLHAASTAQLRVRRAPVVHRVEHTSTKPQEAIEPIEDPPSDGDTTMASSDPIQAPDSDTSFSTMSSHMSSDAIASDPPTHSDMMNLCRFGANTENMMDPGRIYVAKIATRMWMSRRLWA